MLQSDKSRTPPDMQPIPLIGGEWLQQPSFQSAFNKLAAHFMALVVRANSLTVPKRWRHKRGGSALGKLRETVQTNQPLLMSLH